MENSLSENQVFSLIVIGVLIMTAMALALIAYFNYSRRRILVAKQESQELKLKYQEELIQNNIIVQEKERKRIAEDLHDEIGSKLNVINLYMHKLKQSDRSSQRYAGIVEDISSALRHTIQVSRSIAHELMPPTLDNFGLIPALDELIEGINGTGQVKVLVHNQSTVSQLKNKWSEINLYRVIQEMLTNSMKYGDGCTVKLQLDYEDNVLQLEYSDDGPGYGPNDEKNKKGMGLGNITNRLKMVEAKWSDLSELNKGVLYQINYIDQQ